MMPMGATCAKTFDKLITAKKWIERESGKAGEMGLYPDSDAMVLDLKTMKPHVWDFIPMKNSYKYKLKKTNRMKHPSASGCAISITRMQYDGKMIESKRFVAMFHVD